MQTQKFSEDIDRHIYINVRLLIYHSHGHVLCVCVKKSFHFASSNGWKESSAFSTVVLFDVTSVKQMH